MFGSTRLRAYAATVSSAVNRRPSLSGRLLLWAILSLLAVLIFLIVFPLLIIVGVITTAALVAAAIRRVLTRARNPNGMLDGRRNVRVIPRTDTEP